LTTLGIVIGVSTVIAMLSLVQGINTSVEQNFQSIGNNLISVNRYSWVNEGGPPRDEKPPPRITMQELEYIRKLAPAVGLLAPTLYARRTVKFQDNHMNSTICGTTWEYQELEAYYIERGRFINETDNDRAALVAVLGADIVQELFPYRDPVGEDMKIGGRRFTVIGVLEPKGAIMGNSRDNIINIPVNTFFKLYGTQRSVNISAQPKTPELFEEAISQIRYVMRKVRELEADEPDNFAINTSDALMSAFNSLTGVAFGVMIGVGGLSLLVGGIGIMNIMLVSVTERTREIGIRKAIGAKKTDILAQFLVEAISLCAVGGIIGMLLGIGIAKLVSTTTPVPAVIPIWVVFVALGVSTAVGVISGFYPALKASRLNPIDALRYE
jgi:putative ABC transport system permease protein